MARGLYALLVPEQGRPIDPYENALTSDEDVTAAVDELPVTGMWVRVPG